MPSDFLIFRTMMTTQKTFAPIHPPKMNENVTKGKNYPSVLYMDSEITLVIREGLLTFMSWKDPYSQMP